MDFYEKYNLKKVINASGKMTALGVSKYSEEVVDAQKFGGQHFFVMDELVKKTGKHIADLLNAEDGVIVSSASAGLAQSIAGIIGEGSHYHLYHPYTEKITKREIIIPKGHNVDYGTPVEVMIELGGGKAIEAGYANVCTKEQIELMITPETAAILYIKSHHTVQKSMLSIPEAVEVAHKNNLPLILDAAAEEDLFKYIEAGADLVIYSGAKALEGTSSGLIIGKENLVDWSRLQSKGIGRAMKIGKENILGLTIAIEHYLKQGNETGESMKRRLTPFVKQLDGIYGLSCTIVQDSAGRDIFRAKIIVHSESPLSAKQLIEKLKEGKQAIYTREHQVNNGIIECDIRSVNEDEMTQIFERIEKIMNESLRKE
ncbi:DgaE family pyridoxal phosphate-dependent ammonia lyase [Carnobacterium funditum]|uniref:DgaE family pyridoxal phosphate-dependent ammonia lyase n=1 Tax=Carnobacterium funditum TaxID=2752 RepID=UPI000551F216|nr:DgaE family pyridoxal phosphate-dependent ammonia lyase [Carnobacterium funditum]